MQPSLAGVSLSAYIALYPFRRQERWAWTCVFLGVLIWYILDTALSFLHGVYFNVAFNTTLLVLIMLPLAFTRPAFRDTDESVS